MSTILAPVRNRPKINFTETSTLRLLIGVSSTCAVLWAIIATTVGL